MLLQTQPSPALLNHSFPRLARAVCKPVRDFSAIPCSLPLGCWSGSGVAFAGLLAAFIQCYLWAMAQGDGQRAKDWM